jgi:hypothetical protein
VTENTPSGPLRVKPHHFIDIISAFGEGQTLFEPHAYGHAVHTVAAAVLADRNVLLEITLNADDICAPCSHNVEGACDDTIDTSFRPDAPGSKGEWNLIIDKRWSERLDLLEGDRLVARAFVLRLENRMGDITDIYREIPADMTAKRKENIQKGIDFFLQG